MEVKWTENGSTKKMMFFLFGNSNVSQQQLGPKGSAGGPQMTAKNLILWDLFTPPPQDPPRMQNDSEY